MKYITKSCLSLAFLLILIAGCSKAGTSTDVEILNAQGIRDLVHQAEGKVLVINFWATWCPPCREEIPELIELRKKFSDKDLIIIGISVDSSIAAVKEFMVKSTQFNYPVYFAGEDVGSAFNIRAIPRTMIYDPKGEKVFDKSGSFPGAMFERYVHKLIEER